MNKLLSMLTFVRVAESGSFTAAAGQLGVSVSAVAKAIARLEQELDSQLLVRSTRKIALNEDGRKFYGRCREILNDIEDAEASVKSARHLPRGRLRIAMPVLFGRRTFLPRVAEFAAAYPDIVLDVSFEDRRIDLIERGIDVAVQVGELQDSGYITRMLNRGPRLTAASPVYLKRSSNPPCAAQGARHGRFPGRDYAAPDGRRAHASDAPPRARSPDITDKRFFLLGYHRAAAPQYHRPGKSYDAPSAQEVAQAASAALYKFQ